MNENPYRAARREDYVRDIPQEEYDWVDNPSDLEDEMNMAPKNANHNFTEDDDMDMRPKNVDSNIMDDYDMDMRPSPEYVSEIEEMNMAPSEEYSYSYDDVEMNMAPEGYEESYEQNSDSDIDDNFGDLGVDYEDLQDIEGFDEAIGRSR